MDNFSFDHPKVLHLLWGLPVLLGFYLWGFTRKRRAMERFATPNLLNTLIPSLSPTRQGVKAMLTLAAAAAVVIAMTAPRWGTYYEEVPSRGMDIMVALDASNSMLAEDVVPNRLERAKIDLVDMLEALSGDRIGLITFAGKSMLSCPLTINYGSFRLALEAVDTRSTPRGGTNIGDAVRHATNSFADDGKGHEVIIVVTDGEETDESYAVEAARKALEEKGIRVFTVGFGDVSRGTPIPIMTDGQRSYMTHQGEEIRTRLDPTLLQLMAAAADGGYFSNADFRAIYDRVRNKVTPREFASTHREMRPARFHWFAGMTLMLLVIETLTNYRKAVPM